MGRKGQIGLALFGVLSAIIVAGMFMPQRQGIDGAVYAVPPDNDFNVMVCGLFRWLGCPGDRSPDSVFLIFDARELQKEIAGYRARTRGYVPDVMIDLTVEVAGGDEARKFGADYKRLWGMVAEAEAAHAPRRQDKGTRWTRVVYSEGVKDSDGAGYDSFFLLPPGGQHALSADWGPPSCLSAPDQKRVERYDCSYLLRYEGRIYRFTLPEENLAFAGQIPAYVAKRLDRWRAN